MDSNVDVDVARMSHFLTARLTEDLARVWARDAALTNPDRHPGMAAQIEVIHELLSVLSEGRLPERRELRILLWGYGRHADYDPGWTDWTLG